MSTDARSPNPWLSIPASDYESHMSDPRVGQLQYLSDAFGHALARYRPASIACLGCTTGNGFDHLPDSGVRRVLAVDVNPEYLELLRRRHGARVGGLETVCRDLEECELGDASFDLVWAALIFEYVDPAIVIEKISRWLRPGGVLCVVLQLPSSDHPHVSATPITSVRVLEPFIALVDPESLDRLAQAGGLACVMRSHDEVQGKPFFRADYRRIGDDAVDGR